jgi:hypothetical protein
MSQLFPVAAIPSLGAAGAIFLMSRLKTPPQPELAEGLLREQQT